MKWDEGYAGPVVQVRAAKTETLWHECEDGHAWQVHPNGTVSPSYGLGGSEYSWPGYDPATCPEPEHFEVEGHPHVEGIKCPGCEAVRLPCDLLSGLSCSPWELFEEAKRTGHEHSPPPPVCGKPAVLTKRWMEVKTLIYRESKGTLKKVPGWTAGWVPLGEIARLEGKPPATPAQTSLFDDATRARAREMVAESQR